MILNQTKKEYLLKEEKKPDYSRDEALKKMIDERAFKVVKEYLQTYAFSDRKLTDTPTDAFSVVNRKFVTLNGTVANRPTSVVAVVGQSYMATDTNIPMTYTTGGWRDGTGSVVAQA